MRVAHGRAARVPTPISETIDADFESSPLLSSGEHPNWHAIARPEVSPHRRRIVPENRAPVSGIVGAIREPDRSAIGARPECGGGHRVKRDDAVRRDPDGKVARASKLVGVVDTAASAPRNGAGDGGTLR